MTAFVTDMCQTASNCTFVAGTFVRIERMMDTVLRAVSILMELRICP